MKTVCPHNYHHKYHHSGFVVHIGEHNINWSDLS